jgi:hypothetical protein
MRTCRTSSCDGANDGGHMCREISKVLNRSANGTVGLEPDQVSVAIGERTHYTYCIISLIFSKYSVCLISTQENKVSMQWKELVPAQEKNKN